MIDNIKSLFLEFTDLHDVETVERGIIVRTSAWECFLRYPFKKRHLEIVLED